MVDIDRLYILFLTSKKLKRRVCAQKWINMTMKYLALLCDVCSDSELEETEFYKKYGNMIERHRDAFHAPVDRYIINAAWKHPEINLPVKYGKGKRDRTYRDAAENVTAWSRWECKEYCQFQRSLSTFVKKEGKYKNVLDWENEAWISEAEKNNYPQKEV